MQVVAASAAGLSLVVLRQLLRDIGNGYAEGAMAGVVAITVLTAVSVGGLGLQSRYQALLSQLVVAVGTHRIMQRAGSTELEAFESAEFQEWLRRAYYSALARPVVVAGALASAIRSLLSILFVGLAIAAMSPLVLCIVALSRVPGWIASVRASQSMYEFWKNTSELERRRSYLAGLFSMPQTVREMRIYGCEQFFLRRYSSLSNEYAAGLRDRQRREAHGSAVSTISTSAATAVLYGMIAILAIQGHFDLAAGAALLMGAGQFTGHATGLLSALGSLYESVLYLEDALSFLKPLRAAPEPRRTLDERKPARVSAEGISFSYRRWTPNGIAMNSTAGVPALVDVSLTLARGEIVALVGLNGSGKTTLAKVLAGVYVPETGVISVDGVPVNAEWLRSHVAVLFQDFARYMLTARENIYLGNLNLDTRDDLIEQAAREAGAHDFIVDLPLGYDTVLGSNQRTGRELSFGEWQRLGFARATFRRADVLILDEPTAALDPRAEQMVLERIRLISSQCAVLLISHRASTISEADRIYVLDRGRLVEHGTHDQLLRRAGTYADLFLRSRPDPTSSDLPKTIHVSEREAQILALCRCGFTDKEVAGGLGISTATVRTILQRLYRREGFRNRTQAVASFVEAGLRGRQ